MIGRTISHYEIREQIGDGGMGLVFRARDTKLNLSSVQINANSVRIPLGEDGSIHVAAILAPAQSAAENDESYDTKISSLRLASVS